MDHGVSTWISETANSNRQIGNDNEKKRKERRGNTIRANSLYTAFGWIENLPLSEIIEIQKQCHHAMQLVGYKSIDTVTSIQNWQQTVVTGM